MPEQEIVILYQGPSPDYFVYMTSKSVSAHSGAMKPELKRLDHKTFLKREFPWYDGVYFQLSLSCIPNIPDYPDSDRNSTRRIYMTELVGKAIIAQGGGPTAVINQSLVGAALECRKFKQVTHVYGAKHGVSGIINEQFVDLSQATSNNLESVGNTPGAALGSTRDKPDKEYCHKIFEVFRKYNIRYFFYIGGNDSSDTCRIVNQFADEAGYECRCVHIPKTIDNDLVVTDHCPGYGSAAKYVALAFAGANLDNRAIPGVYIAVVMGRHAGFLTAASAAYRRYPDDGPHLVYLPERQFKKEKFLADVEDVYNKHKRCIIAVSEGVWSEKDETGKELPLIATLSRKPSAMRMETSAFPEPARWGTCFPT